MVVQAYNKAIQQGQKTVGFAPASLILTNYFLPVNWALAYRLNTSVRSHKGIRKMNIGEKLQKYRWLQSSLLSYLVLGITDTAHHFHAATALGQSAAMHAVWTGVILIPVAVISVYGYVVYRRKILLWVFMSIALLAVVLPGIYHGGWDHLVKILGHLRLEGERTDIGILFPSGNTDLWFYEVTGSLEFLISLIALYFLGKLFVASR